MRQSQTRLRFAGDIAGIGTAEGTRIVVGRWPHSPFGPIADVMLEQRDGRRILLAPTEQVATFIASTYVFDEVAVGPLDLSHDSRRWRCSSADLHLEFHVGARTPIGWALRLVPSRLAGSPAWATVVDPFARRLLPGVRTKGRATGRRTEWYGALDMHRVTAASATWRGDDLGELRPLTPPVRFGFGSAPAPAAVVSVVTTIELG